MQRCLWGLVVVAALGACKSHTANDRARDVIAHARGAGENGLLELDHLLTSAEWDTLDDATRGEVGGAMVEILARGVPKPFTPDALDQVTRVVTRYQALPKPARDGAARTAMLAALQGWEGTMTQPAQREVKIALLRLELVVAGGTGGDEIGLRLATERLEMARAIEAQWPVDALGFLAEEPRAAAGVEEASKIVKQLVDQPSLLVDAGKDLDAWIASVPATDALRTDVEAKRKTALDAQTEDNASELADAKVAELAKTRPWDQWLVMRLAGAEASAGKMAAAEARLRAIGAPGKMIREARFLLGRLEMSTGELDDADALLSGLLGGRLQRFLAANSALDAAIATVRDRLETAMKTNHLPPDLVAKLEKASDGEQRSLIQGWFADSLNADPTVKARREEVLGYGEVVPASILAGTVKLRRAQQVSGADRDKLLAAAERTFLAVRTAAEGQPEYHLGLAEIYARLGKTTESDAEFKALLDKKDPQTSLAVAHVYRNIGSAKRAVEVATALYEAADTPKQGKESAATLLALLATSDADREKWYQRGDQANTAVRTAVAEMEGRRLLREGKRRECDAKFAESAAISLKEASPQNVAGYNNAALAQAARVACTGDIKQLAVAEATLAKAYQAASDSPLLLINFAQTLSGDADIRVIAKRIDMTVLPVAPSDAGDLVGALLESSERDAVLADLRADAGWRQSADLYAQYEVLAPSATQSYIEDLSRASRLRDPDLAVATVTRMKAAKRLDTSQAIEMMARYRSGEGDAEMLTNVGGMVGRYKAAAAAAQGKTRAAALFLQSRAQARVAMLTHKVEDITEARAARAEAVKLWPALDAKNGLAYSLLEEAGFTADAARWSKMRREVSTAGALAKLVAAKDPMATAILASAQWKQAGDLMRAPNGTPDVDDLRFARLLGDPKVITWAEQVRSDKLQRALAEAQQLMMPGDPAAEADLADLTK